MEEKMKREKNKNRIGNNGEIQTTTEPEPPIGDDDGQSHSIDTAVQLPSSPEEEDETTNYLPDDEEVESYVDEKQQYEEPMRPVIVTSAPKLIERESDRAPSASSLPELPPTAVSAAEVESEKLEVIEIRSDGTSGHLTPGRN